MTAILYQLPGAMPAPSDHPSLNLTAAEVFDASGGYKRPADQLKALHARGFVRAFRKPGGQVVLERAHYEAVVRGQFGQQQAANESAQRAPAGPNRAGFRAKFGAGRKA